MKSINKKMQNIRTKIADIACKNTSVDVNSKVLDFQSLHDWLGRILDKITDNLYK